ncbi:hypothetical protein AK812_SmicGene34515 [Symbiodinium microadriaticum]|uniref:Uncharacterized protein n=1 Tax=Symbiodinium microadriaticum TaxID=2951 RepID=A0A1Q9CNU1_SYMMI|nr:hypothetical protein AK812_SmicGene34515 [Symbiodinium microadriaticum]
MLVLFAAAVDAMNPSPGCSSSRLKDQEIKSLEGQIAHGNDGDAQSVQTDARHARGDPKGHPPVRRNGEPAGHLPWGAGEKSAEESKPKDEEAENINLPEFPNPETYRSWKTTTRVYTVDASHDGLRDAGKFLTLDTLVAARTKVAKGELAREVLIFKETDVSKSRAVRGRSLEKFIWTRPPRNAPNSGVMKRVFEAYREREDSVPTGSSSSSASAPHEGEPAREPPPQLMGPLRTIDDEKNLWEIFKNPYAEPATTERILLASSGGSLVLLADNASTER